MIEKVFAILVLIYLLKTGSTGGRVDGYQNDSNKNENETSTIKTYDSTINTSDQNTTITTPYPLNVDTDNTVIEKSVSTLFDCSSKNCTNCSCSTSPGGNKTTHFTDSKDILMNSNIDSPTSNSSLENQHKKQNKPAQNDDFKSSVSSDEWIISKSSPPPLQGFQESISDTSLLKPTISTLPGVESTEPIDEKRKKILETSGTMVVIFSSVILAAVVFTVGYLLWKNIRTYNSRYRGRHLLASHDDLTIFNRETFQ